MKALRGAPFLSLSSMTLVLVATALYQHQSTLLTPARADTQAQYQRYEEALQLLYAHQPCTAVKLIATLPTDKLEIINTPLADSGTSFAPAVLILRIGGLLARHADMAMNAGKRGEALLLRDTIALLQHRLERGARSDESLLERSHRLQVTEALNHYCQRMTANLALTESLPES